jgi:hypothetical protein
MRVQVMVALLAVLVTVPAWAVEVERKHLCSPGLLLERTDASPSTPEFARAAAAFDQSLKDWKAHGFVAAARGFLLAGEGFATLKAEANANAAWWNAGVSFEAAHRVSAGKVAFETAASRDAAHADKLKARAADLKERDVCPP